MSKANFCHFILKPDFEDFISFMTSTISYILIVSQNELPVKEIDPTVDMIPEDQYEKEGRSYSQMRRSQRNR